MNLRTFHPATWRIRIGASLLVVCIGGATYFGISSAESPRSVPPVVNRPPPDVLKRERAAQVEQFKLLQTDSADWRDTFESILTQQVDKSATLSMLALDRPQVLALVREIASEIEARCSVSTADVVAHITSRPGRWLRPDEDDRAWLIVAHGVNEVTGMPVRRDDPSGAFGVLDGFTREKENAAIRGVAGEAGAMHIRIGRSASIKPIEDPSLDVLEQRDLWMGFATMRANHLWRSEPTLKAVLASAKLATYAHVWITLESSVGRRYVWRSIWYWNPKGKEWLHHESFIQGGAPHGWHR